MSASAGVTLLVFFLMVWVGAAIAIRIGKRKDEYDDKKIQENPQKYLADNLGNNIGGDLYRGARRVDAALDRATKPISSFLGYCKCPNRKCGVMEWHHIDRYTKRHVVRRCVSCNKKWKQER